MASVPTVLIIDQDPEARYQVRQLVERAGFEAAADTGLGTEAVAQAAELRPEIVLCGLKEPLGRALQTIEAVLHDLPETPLIAYAESNDLALIRQAMLAGARDFLHAPFRPDELRRSLAAALESEERRRLRQAGGGIGPRGTIITSFGAKGGSGKTTVSTNLAVALARLDGRSVVLVDADDSFGDVAASLGLSAGRSVTEAVREAGAGGDVKRFLSHHDSGLAVLPAPASPFDWRGISGEELRQTLAELARQFDVVLVDTASALNGVSIAALEAASLVLWVTTLDYASAHGSLRALQAIRNVQVPEERIRILLNVTSAETDVSPASVEEALGQPIFWTVPYDREIRRSSQMGRAVVEAEPGSVAAASFADLAAVLSGAPVEPRNEGILQRLFGNGKTPERRPERPPEQEVEARV